MKKFTESIAFFLAIIFLFSSCSSTTLIDSYPSNAELYLNGESVGFTPYYMTDTKIIGSCTNVTIEKENYKNIYTEICKDEEVDASAIIGGLFFWFPFFWAMKYKPTHFYKLRPMEAGTSVSSEDGSLDQLWKKDSQDSHEVIPSNSVQKSTNETIQENSNTIKLDEARPISEEEFEQQKANKADLEE